MKKGKSTGAKALVKTLGKNGAEIIFGYPGGANLPIYGALKHSSIRHVQARHEQGAAHMADGYARVSGKPGLCMATSGPGATNLVTGIATAYMDSSPVIAITGQVPRSMIGNDAFQEVDITGISIPITKHDYLVQSAGEIAPTVEEAFYLADSGRKGPVLIDIPKDVQNEEFPFDSEKRRNLEGYRPTVKGHPGQIKRAAALLKEAKKPVIIAGGGVVLSSGFEPLRTLVDNSRIPVVYSLMGKSALDNDHPLNLGLFGYHGRKVANAAVSEADLILAVGTRFGDRSTGPLNSFARNAQIIHIDVDPAEIGKNVPAYLPIVGDISDILPRLCELVDRDGQDRDRWLRHLGEIQAAANERSGEKNNLSDSNPPDTKQIIVEASRIYHNPLVVTDVGRHQIYAAQYFPVAAGRNFITSGGLGTMGFGLPAAIGASLAAPDREVVLISGDGSFLMNMQELLTAAEAGAHITALVMNDARLGMIQQLQDAFYDSQFEVSKFISEVPFDEIAKNLGCQGYRISQRGEVGTLLRKISQTKGVKVVNCLVGEESHIYPMVTGSNLLEMIEGE